MCPQDPKAVALRKKFEDALAAAEQEMIRRNADPGSRARHSPAGVPYRLMYPSVKTDPPTAENQGMTGCGIPWVPPTPLSHYVIACRVLASHKANREELAPLASSEANT